MLNQLPFRIQSVFSFTDLVPNCASFLLPNVVTKQQYTHYEQSVTQPFFFFQMYLDYSLMKIPQNYNLPSYRFPTQGKNYISVPGEALTMQCEYAHLTHTHTQTLRSAGDPCPDYPVPVQRTVLVYVALATD